MIDYDAYYLKCVPLGIPKRSACNDNSKIMKAMADFIAWVKA